MGRPRKTQGDVETQEKLLQAAEVAFGARGFKATRLEDVAAAAGIRRSSLLYYFKTKRVLYESVVRRAFTELRGAIEQGMSGQGTLFERLDATTHALIAVADRRPAVFALMLRELISFEPDALVQEEFVDLVDALDRRFRDETSGVIAESFPTRSAILTLFLPHLVRAASGSVGERLWRGEEATAVLLRALVLGATQLEAGGSNDD